MRKALIFATIFIILPTISSAEQINGFEVEWEGSSYTMSWANPTVSIGDYVVRIIDFDWKGNAAISVDRNGVVQYGVLSEGEDTVFNFTANSTSFQGIKIEAGKISNYQSLSANTSTNIGTYPCCPAAEVSIEIAKEAVVSEKKPELTMALSLDWDGRSGYSSLMDLVIENTGEESFSEGNVTIDLNGLKPADAQELANYALTYNSSKGTLIGRRYTPLLANESYEISVHLKSPFPPDKNMSEFTVKVDGYFKDLEGTIYPATVSSTVSLNPTIRIDKTITASTILGERDTDESGEVYVGLGRVTAVNIYVKNLQSYPVRSLNLTDTAIEGFRLTDNKTKLQWVFDLNASERKEFRYEMLAHRIGTFTAPAAVANWTEWGNTKTASSNTPVTRVYGAFVVISKKTDKLAYNLNESINVSVGLNNIGDFPIGVNITDILPENTTLISGTKKFKGLLGPQEQVSLTYSLSAGQPGVLELPSPIVSFLKKGHEDSYEYVRPQNVTVGIQVPPATTVQAETATTVQAETATTVQAENPNRGAPALNVSLGTKIPKSLIDIIGEKAPWFEGVIPLVMLFIAVFLMLILHVLNR